VETVLLETHVAFQITTENSRVRNVQNDLIYIISFCGSLIQIENLVNILVHCYLTFFLCFCVLWTDEILLF